MPTGMTVSVWAVASNPKWGPGVKCSRRRARQTRQAQPAAARVMEARTVHVHPCTPGTGWGAGGLLWADRWARAMDALEAVEPGPSGAALLGARGQRLQEVPTSPGRALG